MRLQWNVLSLRLNYALVDTVHLNSGVDLSHIEENHIQKGFLGEERREVELM